MEQLVFVDWDNVEHEDDESWNQRRCLYAYGASNREILYIGKAWAKTVRERWQFEAKPHFWTQLERERQIFHHCILVGTIALYPGERLTHELLMDVESLLIQRLQPWGNIQSRLTRIERPGLMVQCRGSWPGRSRRFRDAA